MRFLITICIVFSLLSSEAGTFTTTATVGTWAEGGSPDKNDDIVVNHDWSSQNSGLGNALSICQGSISVNSGGYYKVWGSLVVQGGGDVTVSSGGTMEVSGSLDINGAAGTIVFDGAFITVGATVNGAAVTGVGTWTWSGSFTNNGTINGTTDDPASSPIALSSLPVELAYFSVSKISTEGNVVLDWQTVSELNNEVFIIEKSEDGIAFYPIGEVLGAGTTSETINYQFIDDGDVSSVVYYRLRQRDYDGTEALSNTVFFNGIGQCGITTNIYNGVLSCFFCSANQPRQISILSSSGQILLTKEVRAGETIVQISLGGFSSDLYFIDLHSKTSRTVSKVLLE